MRARRAALGLTLTLLVGACALDRAGSYAGPAPEGDGMRGSGGSGVTTTGATTGSGTSTGATTSTATGTTTTTSTTTTATTTTTSTTTTLPEDCTNGADDDGDGDADCADDDCSPDYGCVPEPPAGTLEVVYVSTRANGADPADCGATLPLAPLHEGVAADATGCACTCGAPTGAACSADAVLWQYGDCTGPSDAFAVGKCDYFVLFLWTIGGISAKNVQLTAPGACQAGLFGAPAPATPLADVDRCAAALTPTAKGCSNGSVCARKPAVAAPACVEVASGAACPAAFPDRHELFEGLDDGRSCALGSCACDAPTDQGCDVTVSLYDTYEGSCSANKKKGTFVSPGGACVATGYGVNDAGSASVSVAPVGGSCAPTGSPSTVGDVNPTNAVAYCCATP